MMAVVGHLTPEETAIVEAAGYAPGLAGGRDGAAATWGGHRPPPGCGPPGLLAVGQRGVEVVVLNPECGEIADTGQALIAAACHVATSDDDGLYVEDRDDLFHRLSRALGIVFQEPRTVWANLDELGIEECRLPRDGDGLAQAWLARQHAVVVGHAWPEEAAALAGHERAPPEAVRELLGSSGAAVWVDCDAGDLVTPASRPES